MEPVQSTSEKWGIKKILLGLVLVLVTIIFWTWISSPVLLSVTGRGEVSVPATSAVIGFSVSATDVTAQGATTGIAAKVASLTQLLRNKGVSEEDIASSQIQLVPAGLVTAGTTGFQASVTMSAKTTNVSNTGALIDALYSSGASVVSQPTLIVEKQDALEQNARDAALKDAKTQVGKFALKNWKFVRKIVAVSYQSSGSTSTSTTKADTLTGAKSAEAAANGVFKIVSIASVTYKLW